MTNEEWQAAREKRCNPEPQQFNSTFRGDKKPMNKVSKKHRLVMKADSVLADAVMSRDAHECQACLWLSNGDDRVDATVVHHVARKLTNLGVDVRFLTGYQVALCQKHHDDEHASPRRLEITVIPEGDLVTQDFVEIGAKGNVTRQARREAVSNWNPLAEESEAD